MLSPSFVVKLGQPFQQGLVTIGRFDGKTPTLCCATTGGKILLHNPHEGEKNLANDGENRLPTVRYLNFNKKITSIAAGR
jgi:Bardet-Biedl syndrome 2 protein